MTWDPTNFEAMLELLDDKIVRTSKGSFIAVDDLKALQKELAGQRKEEKEAPKFKTMAAAREAALSDEEFVKRFGDPQPQAPVVGHVNPVGGASEPVHAA